MEFKKLNLITGWLIFLVAAWTYITTIEPTASFWDCGEFIATAYRLEVTHPPGAPLFMLLGRVASAFVSPENVPVAVNVLSALASAFTILFLFWSITHMALKLALRSGELTNGKIIAVLGSGAVGALAYTWSDSFWFSAVEGEVYALSSFFTAIVFWAILKWESEADEPHSTRWLVLIAYLMGLSIGVHLLNLLCIPAIAFVYYFKKYKATPMGIAWTFVISAVILGTIQSIIIPGIVRTAGRFELLFVNSMGMPFNTGTVVYAALLIGLIVWGLFWTQRHGKVILNTIVLGVSVILVGYSTYAMIVVRSQANPPIDMNNPENVFSLLSYLNREQYGDRPLLMGQFWGSEIAAERGDGNPVYSATYKVMDGNNMVIALYDKWSAKHYVETAAKPSLTIKHAYVMTDARKGTEVNYTPETTVMFPRMYSSQASHAQAYKSWSDFKGKEVRTATGAVLRDRDDKPLRVPTMGENLTFFWSYQMDWMYWRYFMWNFAGRQNDIQGHGGITDGNWYTGIKAIDAERLGNQDHLPESMTANKGMNKLYLLPLLLGVIGLVYQLLRHFRDWTIVLLLFFFTGIAIVIYLNQTPYQPRERDYAYVGSFYAFAIWIGLGVYALFDAAHSLKRKDLLMATGVVLGLGVLKYLLEGLAGQHHAVSYTLLYMGAVGGGAMLAMHFVGTALRNERAAGILATAVAMVVPIVMVRAEWNDHDRRNRTPARDLASNYLESCAPNAILFTNGDNDTFPLWYAQEVEGIRTDVRVVNLSLLNTDWYIDQMRRKAYESPALPISIEPAKYRQGTRDVVALIPREQSGYLDLKRAIQFSANDENMRPIFSRSNKDAYIPSQNFRLPADSAYVFGKGAILNMADTSSWVSEVRWTINRQYVMKNHYIVLDMLANNNWERPIYFAVTTGPDSYIGLQDHFRLEGLTYRLVPKMVRNPSPNSHGSVATDIMYNTVKNNFLWGGMDSPNEIYLDENVLRMTTNLRLQIATLADALTSEGKPELAREMLDLVQNKLPEHNVPYDRIMLAIAEAYYRAGDIEAGNTLSERLAEIMADNLSWYVSLEDRFLLQVSNDAELAHTVIARLAQTAANNGQTELAERLREQAGTLGAVYNQRLQDMQRGRRETRVSF